METLATRLVPIWLSAKGFEFDSLNLRLGIEK